MTKVLNSKQGQFQLPSIRHVTFDYIIRIQANNEVAGFTVTILMTLIDLNLLLQCQIIQVYHSLWDPELDTGQQCACIILLFI